MSFQSFINGLMMNPNQTFIGSLAIAAGLILFDVKTGLSVNPPGPQRFGLAGITALSGAIIFAVARFGVQNLIDTVALDLISFGLIGGVIVTFFLARGRM